MISATELDCKCTSKTLSRRTYRNGTHHFMYQCISCGMHDKSISHEEVNRLIAAGERWEEYDEERADKYRSMIRRQNQLDRLDEKDRRMIEYNEYLQSDEWKSRRAKVLRRAGGLCEGCLEAKAVHVHHCNYTHCGDELLFDLVAVCKDCHEKAHGGNNGE